MVDSFDWIKETAQDFQPIYDRNDADADLYNLVKYQLRDLLDKQPLKDVVNITMNDPKVFADKVQASMNDATMQAVVEGHHLSDRDTTLIENFDADMHYEIDTRLLTRDITSLKSFLIEQACFRGTLAARYACWSKDELPIPDLLPCDSRYLVYEYGDTDLERAAFRSLRTKASIVNRYPDAEKVLPDFKKASIWEDWDKESWRIWVGPPDQMAESGQLVFEDKNIFGYVPFIIQGVGAGSMMQDENSRKHRFESIFAPNRGLYEDMNMLGSILQTLNYFSFNRAYEWESDAGVNAKKPPSPTTRQTIPIDKGTRGLFPVEIADISNATRLLYAVVSGAIQRGSLPNIDYGNLTFQLSAVAINKLTAQKDSVRLPRLDAIGRFYRCLHYMMRDQYIQGGYTAELGEEGLERVYNANDLIRKYKISYRFFPVSPEQDIANHAVAQQALSEGLPRHYVYTNILKVQNPEGLIMEGLAEKAEQVDPVIGLFRYGHALIEKGTEESFLESDIVAKKIEELLREPQALPEGGSTKPDARSLIPLLGGGGGGGASMEEEAGGMSAPEEMMRREERREEVVRKNEAEG